MKEPATVARRSTRRRIKSSFLDELFYMQGKFPALATKNDYYMALAYAVRDRMLQRWISTAAAYTQAGLAHRGLSVRRVPDGAAPRQQSPQSRHPRAASRSAWPSSASICDELLQQEEEPGLGQRRPRPAGGLLHRFAGDAARCRRVGYGIRYEFGIFHQEIVDGWQVEKTDKWLRFGNPWELVRPEWAVRSSSAATPRRYADEHERPRMRWVPHKIVMACPTTRRSSATDVNTANTLRLWRAEAPESFDFAVFNSGDYYGAVNQKVTSENLSKVLYPNDEQLRGKELRLEQQYFFVSCSLAGHAAHPAHPEAAA